MVFVLKGCLFTLICAGEHTHPCVSSASPLHQQQLRIHSMRHWLLHRSEMKFLSSSFFRVLAWSLLVSSGDMSSSADVPDALKTRSWNELFQVTDLTRSVQTHRRAPRFMTELYDAVADSSTSVLEGSTVRSFAGVYTEVVMCECPSGRLDVTQRFDFW